MALVKVGSKNEVIIPEKIREELGIEPGDYVEISLRHDQAVIERKRSGDDFPYTDEAIGPETRAAIQEALDEVSAGNVAGPFNTAEELQDHLDSLKKPGSR